MCRVHMNGCVWKQFHAWMYDRVSIETREGIWSKIRQ